MKKRDCFAILTNSAKLTLIKRDIEMIRYENLAAPFGKGVYGIDLSVGITEETLNELTQALYKHRLLVLKEQTCDKDSYLKFGRLWGTPIQHVVDTIRMPGYPDLISIGNLQGKDEESRNSAAFWHTDQAYDADAVSYTHLTLPTKA